MSEVALAQKPKACPCNSVQHPLDRQAQENLKKIKGSTGWSESLSSKALIV